MLLNIEERLAQQLQNLAHQQQRELMDVVRDAVEQYIARQAEEERFDAAVDRIMRENRWLLDELAKQ